MPDIIIVEDNREIGTLLCDFLRKENYTVSLADTGEKALEIFEQYGANLVVLDIGLPGVDGYSVCSKIRETSNAHIMIATARDDKESTLKGLQLGADDYIVKPFDSKEVVARVKAVLRRSAAVKEPEKDDGIVEYDKLKININNYEMIVDGKAVDTPPKELELIYHLASNPNRVYTRDQLLDEVWGFDYSGYSRTVDVHIKRLREKLEGVSDKWELRTIWRVGYKFETKE